MFVKMLNKKTEVKNTNKERYINLFIFSSYYYISSTFNVAKTNTKKSLIQLKTNQLKNINKKHRAFSIYIKNTLKIKWFCRDAWINVVY